MKKSNKLLFLAGTSAEAIKLAPVIRRLHSEKIDYEFIWTGQHVNLADQSFDYDFLPINGRLITKGWRQRNPVNFLEFCIWYAWMNCSLLCYLLVHRPKILVIHGDTLSALAGAYVGRFLRINVAHIEAGYRNSSPWSPFPEEITRRMISRFATLNFAPGSETVQNLLSQGIQPGKIFDTFDNTAIDNLYDLEIKNEMRGFGLVTLHRTEFLTNYKLLSNTFLALNDYARNNRIYVVADHRLINALEKVPKEFLSNLEIVPKMKYLDFIRYAASADFIVTDSGGLRQEMEHLGKPVIIHRAGIEYEISGASSLRVTHWEIDELIKLINHHLEFRTSRPLFSDSPSAEIVRIVKNFL